MSEQTRICRTCKKRKPLNQFCKDLKNNQVVYRYVCIECRTEKRAISHQANKLEDTDVRWLNFLFPPRCGGCGKKIAYPSRKLSNRGYLCQTCSRAAEDREKYKKLYEDVMGKESLAIAACPNCAFLLVCQVRLQVGLWMVCEMPDRGDIARAQAIGIETDGHDIIVSREHIKDKMVWPAWWPDTVNIGDGQPLVVERVNHEPTR